MYLLDDNFQFMLKISNLEMEKVARNGTLRPVVKPVILVWDSVLPDGCKFVIPSKYGPCYVVEEKPTIKNLFYNKQMYRLSLPYVIFIYSRRFLKVFVRTTPLKSIYDLVYFPPFPNVYEDSSVCLGSGFDKCPENFWRLSFNDDIDYRNLYQHTVLHSFELWQEETKRDPSFILDMDFVSCSQLVDHLPKIELDLGKWLPCGCYISETKTQQGVVSTGSLAKYKNIVTKVNSIWTDGSKVMLELSEHSTPVPVDQVQPISKVEVDRVTLGDREFQTGDCLVFIRDRSYRSIEVKSIIVNKNGLVEVASNETKHILSLDGKKLLENRHIYQVGDRIDAKRISKSGVFSTPWRSRRGKYFTLHKHNVTLTCEDGSRFEGPFSYFEPVDEIDIEAAIINNIYYRKGLSYVSGFDENYNPITDRRFNGELRDFFDGKTFLDAICNFSIGDKVFTTNMRFDTIEDILVTESRVVLKTSTNEYKLIELHRNIIKYKQTLTKSVDELTLSPQTCGDLKDVTLQVGMRVAINRNHSYRLASLNRSNYYEIIALVPEGFLQNEFPVMILSNGATVWLDYNNIQLLKFSNGRDISINCNDNELFPRSPYTGKCRVSFRRTFQTTLLMPTTKARSSTFCLETETFLRSQMSYSLL